MPWYDPRTWFRPLTWLLAALKCGARRFSTPPVSPAEYAGMEHAVLELMLEGLVAGSQYGRNRAVTVFVETGDTPLPPAKRKIITDHLARAGWKTIAIRVV